MPRNWTRDTTAVDTVLDGLLLKAKSDGIRDKLRRLHEVCRDVLQAKGGLTVPSVVEEYTHRLKEGERGIAEPSIRNKREGKNPYNTLFLTWVGLAKAGKRAASSAGEILAMEDLDSVEDMTLRHQLKLLVHENRALKAQNGILRQVHTLPIIQIVDPTTSLAVAEPSTEALFDQDDIEILQDFVDPRKLGVRELRRTEDGGIVTAAGRRIADPGFVGLLERIIKRHR